MNKLQTAVASLAVLSAGGLAITPARAQSPGTPFQVRLTCSIADGSTQCTILPKIPNQQNLTLLTISAHRYGSVSESMNVYINADFQHA